MVNSFILCSDFALSATMIDRQRLGKQRLEGKQLIEAVYKVHFASSFIQSLGYKLPRDTELLHLVRYIIDTYKSLNCVHYFHYVYENDHIKDIAFTEQPVSPDCKQVKFAWCNHPCTRMWYYHIDALKAYVNSIIQEWIRRGYNNTMKMYYTNQTYERPWWMGYFTSYLDYADVLQRKNADHYSFLGTTDCIRFNMWCEDISCLHMSGVTSNELVGFIPS
jgi:hypothetical protein